MFFLMIQTGIRQSEIIDLDIHDYYEGFIKIKGKQSRRIALSENTQKTLDEYLKMMNDYNDDLFVRLAKHGIDELNLEESWTVASDLISKFENNVVNYATKRYGFLK